MTQQNDQWPRYGAPKDYDHRYTDYPFPKRNWWPWVALVAVLVVVWVVNA